MYRNRLVQGCPYEVNVTAGSSTGSSGGGGGVGLPAASKVTCTGDGLGEGAVPQQFRVNIDARRAPPGTSLLSVKFHYSNESPTCRKLVGYFSLVACVT